MGKENIMTDAHKMVPWALAEALGHPLTPDQQNVARAVLLALMATHETITVDQAIVLIDRLEDAGMDATPPEMDDLAEMLNGLEMPEPSPERTGPARITGRYERPTLHAG